MSRSLNKATLIGNIGKDPEMRFMPNGNAVCNFTMATDESYNDRNSGQKVEKVEWHRISAFGKLAEIMGQYLHKGSKVYIEGKLQTREWEKDGIKRYTTEIVASDMLMLDGAQNAGGQQNNSYQQPQQPMQQPMQNQGGYQQPQQAPQRPVQQTYNNPPPQQQTQRQHPQQQNNGGYQQPQQPQQPVNPNQGVYDDFDDDIPF